ncbi:MAG: hypothetical protein EPN69_14260 [Rhodanobacter sp.]|nr:MAG: hypothetical protein EPN69_14260 [Rhodanobacter sp.]TAL95952.1 MAG: hypothetical protein EPN71_09605 [Rhodanobacter sp.]TAM40384.1 MAG: hypothetical protein EPN58_10275 [Rhodanobacter sp.]TAN23209.1 MAG: hypothetical protein EPN32_11960 [Rhodanobacter sp.]
MPDHDPRGGAYSARPADFARPILQHLRALIHQTGPEVLDQQGENQRHPPATHRHHAGMAGRRQETPLEIREMLKAAHR